MKLGKYEDLKSAIAEAMHVHPDTFYIDDCEVVMMDSPDGASCGYLSPSAEGWLTLRDPNGAVIGELEVEGAGFEPHELDPAATRH